MPRTRLLKPGFFMNDALSEVPPLGRLLFAGLWTLADREGRLEDRPKKIKAELLPFDNANVDKLLDELGGRGFIRRYEVRGQRLIQIPSFLRHQQPHFKEPASILPAPDGHEDSGVIAGAVPEKIRLEVMRRDGMKCVRCGAGDKLAIDHIVPRSKGGSSGIDNLQTLCRRCNSAKGNRQTDANDGAIMDDASPINGPSSNADTLTLNQIQIPSPDPYPPAAAPRDGDDGFRQVTDSLTRLGARLNPLAYDDIGGLLDEGYRPEWFALACMKAAENSATSWAYVRKVLTGWGLDGPPPPRERSNGNGRTRTGVVQQRPDDEDPIEKRLRLDAEREARQLGVS